MEFNQFIRRPFIVEAVEITSDNIEEVAKIIGRLQIKGEVTFIDLDRRVVPTVRRAYIGWYVTRLGNNYRCYSAKVFKEEFFVYADEITFKFGVDEVEETEETEVETEVMDAPREEEIDPEVGTQLTIDEKVGEFDVV